MITSSPGSTPTASKAACKVAVPELNATAYLDPKTDANSFSKLFTHEPPVLDQDS